MPVPALGYLQSLLRQLGDETGVHWTPAEVQGWVNMAQRTACLWKPDSYVRNQFLALVPGPKQTLPADWVRLFDVVRNAPGHGGAVTLVERKDLPWDWAESTVTGPGTGVQHYAYLPQDARTFYIYPHYAAPTTNQLEVSGGCIAPDVDVFLEDSTVNPWPLSADFLLDDVGALHDYAMFRACLKDTAHGMRDRAAFYAQQFLIALGKGKEAALMSNPQRILNVQGEQP